MQSSGIWKFGGLGAPIGIDISGCIGRPIFRDCDLEIIDILLQFAESGALKGLNRDDPEIGDNS
jgi:hypothetical protein